MTKLPILKRHVLCMLIQFQFSFKHNANLIFTAIFLSSFVSWERLILYMQLVENFKCFQPPISLSTDQQRQHSIQSSLCFGSRVATCRSLKKTHLLQLKKKPMQQVYKTDPGGYYSSCTFCRSKQTFSSLSLALILYVFTMC